MPPRPKRSAPDCQLSAPQANAESWQTGASRQSQSGLWLGRPTRPSSLPPRPVEPDARTARPPRPPRTATPPVYDPLRSGCVMKECFRLQPQELLSVVPPRCRIPLAREPSAHGSPPPHRKASCRRRNPGGPSAARCTKDNSVLWPGACRACHAHCFAAGCPDPGPPPAPQCARQSLLHPSRHTPHSAPLFSLAGSQPTPGRALAPSIPGGRAQRPRSLRCATVRDFVATRYRSASAASSPPTPSSSASTFSTSSGRFGSCCMAGKVSASRPQRRWMNNFARTLAPPSPNLCITSAQPLTRSMFAGFSVMPSRAYCPAMVVPSLCRLKTSVPATIRRRSPTSSARSPILWRPTIARMASACR